MDALNTVPGSGPFSHVVSVINENLELITDAISQMELNVEKFAGVFSSSDDLPTTGMVTGCWAAVLGTGGFPAAIYEYDGTAWSDSGKTWEPDSAATAAVEQAKEDAIDAINDEKDSAVSTIDAKEQEGVNTITEIVAAVDFTTGLRTLALGKCYEHGEMVVASNHILKRLLYDVTPLNLTSAVAVGDLRTSGNATYKAASAVSAYNSATTYADGDYALGRPSVMVLVVDVEGLEASGNIFITLGTENYTVAVTQGQTASEVAAAIVTAIGTLTGWTVTDNEDGTLSIKNTSAGNNALAFAFEDTGETGVVVTSTFTAGAATVSKYDGSAWAAATTATYLTDKFTSLTLAQLEALCINSSINNSVSQVKKYTDITNMVNGAYTQLWNKAAGAVVTLATNSDASYRRQIVDCVEGDIFSFDLKSMSGYYPTVCFLDAGLKILWTNRNSTESYKDGRAAAPKNARYVIFMSSATYDNHIRIVGKCDKIDDKVTFGELNRQVIVDDCSSWLAWSGGRYYPEAQCRGFVGSIAPLTSTSANTGAKYILTSCTEGDVFWANLTKFSAARVTYAFLDEDNVILSCSQSSVTSQYLVAPRGAVKVLFMATSAATCRVMRTININDLVNLYYKEHRRNITFWQFVHYKSVPDVGGVMNYTTSGGSYSQIVECTEGDCFYFQVHNQNSQFPYPRVVFIDANDKVIWRESAGAIGQSRGYQYYTVPKGAVKLLVQGNIETDKIYRVGTIDKSRSDLLGLIGYDEAWRLYNNKGYLTGVTSTPVGGTVTDFTSLPGVVAYNRYALMECSAGDSFYGDQGRVGTWSFSFLDANNVVIGRVSGDSRYFSAVAPSGTTRVHLYTTPAYYPEIDLNINSLVRNGRLTDYDVRIQDLETGRDYPYGIVCPDTFYAVAGIEKVIYKDSLIRGIDDGLNSPMGLSVDFECASFNHQGYTNVGIRRPRHWQLQGSLLSSHTGKFTFRINVFNQKSVNISTKDCQIRVCPATGLSSAKNILCIGDSLTAGGEIVATCKARFTALGGTVPTFWGSKTSTVDGVTVKHEGRSGWEWQTFTASGSPFYISGGLNIASYRSNIGMGDEKFDLVIFMLGVNNSVLGTGNGVSQAKSLINAFLADNPNTKFIIQLQPMDNNTTDGWEVYASDSLSNGKKMNYQSNTWAARSAMMAEFNKNESWPNVYIGDAAMGLDRYWGYPYTEGASSARISKTEVKHTNCVHPNADGYKQLGDGFFFQSLAILSGLE